MPDALTLQPITTAPPIALMGVPFDNVTMDDAIRIIDAMIASRQPHSVVTANVDFLVQSQKDPELHRVLMQADLVLCDGTPLVWLSKILGNPLPERVAGSDLAPKLLQFAARKKYRVFLLGGTEDSNNLAAERLESRYPGLIICGHYAPPYAPLAKMNHGEIIGRIRNANADLLFVSFGCPKQEKWIAMHYQALGVPVAIGVGATIDFLAGRARRAPVWMRRSGLEWVFRLVLEPRRLFGRYARDLVLFGIYVLAQFWRTRLRGIIVKAPDRPPAVQHNGLHDRIVISGKLDIDAVQRHAEVFEHALWPGHVCEVDLSGVRFIDSTGIGLLLRLWRLAGGSTPVLLKPNRSVRAALHLMSLDGFFRTVSYENPPPHSDMAQGMT